MGNFEDFITKSVSTKKILIELDIGDAREGWYNYLVGIWAWRFYTKKTTYHTLGQGNLGFGPLGGSDTSESGNSEWPIDISSVRVDGTLYTEAVTLANCIANDSSWYYNTGETILYFHGANYTEPQIHTIIVGLKNGYTNHAGYYNGAYYEPRISDVVNIQKSKDLLEFGIMSFDEATFTLANNDGFLDNFFDKYVFGQPVTILFGGDDLDYTDYRTMFKGFVAQARVDEEAVEVTAKDDRKKLSRELPVNTFNATTYPELDSKYVGQPIPLVYGTCYNVTCTPVNTTGSSYMFVVADVADHAAGIGAVSTAYVNGVSKTIASTNLPSAYFRLASANYSIGQAVTADVRGFSVLNSLSVITDVLSCYTNIYYASATFDTVTWETMSASAFNVGVVINDKTKIYDMIEKIALSNGANFLIKDDGTFSWTKYLETATVTATVKQSDILEGEALEPTTDAEEFLTSASVGYRKDWAGNKYAWYTDTSEETNGFNKYFRYKGQQFETYLTNATDAQVLAAAVMDYMKDPRMKLRNATGGVQFVDREVGELVNLNGDRPAKPWMGTVLCEIVEITKELSDTPKVIIVGREVPE